MQVDDAVTVASSNNVLGKWAVGRILNVYPESDGWVHNVRLKTATGEYNRPVTKMDVIHLFFLIKAFPTFTYKIEIKKEKHTHTYVVQIEEYKAKQGYYSNTVT